MILPFTRKPEELNEDFYAARQDAKQALDLPRRRIFPAFNDAIKIC
jgi:hypothetical protein